MPLPTKQNSYNDPQERERLLMQYAGIFKYQIKEFAQVASKKMYKARTNFSK